MHWTIARPVGRGGGGGGDSHNTFNMPKSATGPEATPTLPHPLTCNIANHTSSDNNYYYVVFADHASLI